MIPGRLISGQSPTIDITIQGVNPQTSKTFTAIIDTGFTGYAQIPLVQAFGLALVLESVSTAKLADGSVSHLLLCWGTITAGEKQTNGFIALSPNGQDILLGMQWLKSMEMVLHVDAANNATMLVPSVMQKNE